MELPGQFKVWARVNIPRFKPSRASRHPLLHRRWPMRIEEFSVDGARVQNRAEKFGNKTGLAGRNEIAQRRGVGYNSYRQAQALPGTIRKLLERLGFTVQLGGIVIIKIDVACQEIFGLDAREREELADLKLGETTLSVAVNGERLQGPTRQIASGPREGARQVVRDAKRDLHGLSITESTCVV